MFHLSSASATFQKLPEKAMADAHTSNRDRVQNGTGLTEAFSDDVRPREAFWKVESFSASQRLCVDLVTPALLAHTWGAGWWRKRPPAAEGV